MKSILTILLFFIFVVSGSAQTRNVVVGTNGAVVQPTNFWSADVTNARSGLGLGSAATNPASAFQPASSVLSNLVSGGALTFSNITVGISNVTGLQTALDGKLGTNPTLFIANISNLQTTLDSKLGTNPTLQISNIAALQTALDAKLTASFPLAISNVSGLQSALDTKLGTNPTLGISNITGLQTNLDSKLSTTGSAANLTNFPTVALASNITGTAALATNVTGVVALVNGGTGATNISGARTALGVGSSDVFVGLTNLGSGGNLGFSSSPYILGSTNSTTPNNAVLALDAAGVRSVAGLTLAALTNTTTSDFRTAIGLGSAATNPATAFQPSSSVLTNLASSNAINLTNLQASNLVGLISASNIASVNLTNISGTLAINSGGTGATNAADARSNLGLGSASTNPSSAFQPSSVVLSNLSATNGSDLTNITAANITGTVALASNVTGTIAISNGGSGATTAGGARTNYGLVWTGLTNTNASGFRSALELSASWLTNTNVTNFRTAVGLGTTNDVVFSIARVNTLTAETGQVLVVQSPSGLATLQFDDNTLDMDATTFQVGAAIEFKTTTNAATTRTNLGLGSSDNFNIGQVTLQGSGSATNPAIRFPVTQGTNIVYNGFAWAGANSGRLSYTHENSTIFVLDGALFRSFVPFGFEGAGATTNAAITRTNFGLGWPALTNTNAGTGLVSVNTNGEVVSPTNFWQVSPANTRVQLSQPNGATNSVTNTATNARNLYLYSLTTNVVNTTNTILLPTNSATLLGDVVTVIHEGPTSSVTAIRQTGAGSNLITLNQFQEAVKFIYESAGWRLADNISYVEPIYFSGTNATANAAASRTNLGLGATWLTNTSVTNFQKAIFYTNTAPSNIGGNLGTIAAWIEIVASNGVTYKIPAYTNVP